MNIYAIAAVWTGLALIASLISIRAGIAVALAEIVIGALAGNLPGISGMVQETAFTTFLAGVGSITLTFLAGAEIDPVSRAWGSGLSRSCCRFSQRWRWPISHFGGTFTPPRLRESR